MQNEQCLLLPQWAQYQHTMHTFLACFMLQIDACLAECLQVIYTYVVDLCAARRLQVHGTFWGHHGLQQSGLQRC